VGYRDEVVNQNSCQLLDATHPYRGIICQQPLNSLAQQSNNITKKYIHEILQNTAQPFGNPPVVSDLEIMLYSESNPSVYVSLSIA
jgi:hypothetical protein